MQHEAIPEIQAATTLEALLAVKTRYVGKSGLVTRELGSLGKLPPEERKARGAEINAVRQAIQDALDTRETTLKREALDAQLASEAIDVTLPGLPLPSGGLHPINRVYDDLTGIYERLGYVVVEGPDVEDEHHHLVCTRCGAVRDVMPDLETSVARRERRDFTITAVEVIFRGHCDTCS